jgi:Transposase IS4
MSLVSEHEWWVAWGVIFAACPCHTGGIRLFKDDRRSRRVTERFSFLIDSKKFDGKGGFKRHMSWDRFKKIKEWLHRAFHGDHADVNNPWYQLVELEKAYNENRKHTIANGTSVVLDEGMSAFQPRTTATSTMPKISFVKRKPKPLGTEFKMAACTETKINLFIESQQRPEDMKMKAYHTEVGATASCTLRCVVGAIHGGLGMRVRQEAFQRGRKHLIIADSWFGSVKLAEALKCLWWMPDQSSDNGSNWAIDTSRGENPTAPDLIAAVITNSSWFPLNELIKRMRKYPAGSHLVTSCTTPVTNIKLKAIGYKWNSKAVRCFVMTENAASTYPLSTPYLARYSDEHGNVLTRKVVRPEVCAIYYKSNNIIDVHNQLRQHSLGLERHWKTPNPWFKEQITIIAMTVIDCQKALKYHVKDYREHGLPVEEFANYLAYDCINNHFTSSAGDPWVYLAANPWDGSKLLLDSLCCWLLFLTCRQRDNQQDFQDFLDRSLLTQFQLPLWKGCLLRAAATVDCHQLLLGLPTEDPSESTQATSAIMMQFRPVSQREGASFGVWRPRTSAATQVVDPCGVILHRRFILVPQSAQQRSELEQTPNGMAHTTPKHALPFTESKLESRFELNLVGEACAVVAGDRSFDSTHSVARRKSEKKSTMLCPKLSTVDEVPACNYGLYLDLL